MKSITKEQIKRWMPSLNGHHYYIETVKRGKEYILIMYGHYNIEYLCSKANVKPINFRGAYKYNITSR